VRAPAALRRHGAWAVPLLALAAAIGLLALDRDGGLPALGGLQARTEAARERILVLRQERDALYREIGELRSRGPALEARARETLGMVHPGDLVLVWEPPGASR
jgi:cell division protein FtsB